MKNEIMNYIKKLETIKECIIDYSAPIYIVGDVPVLEGLLITVISAIMPKNEFLIINNKYPKWLTKVLDNSEKDSNILLIKDFDKISTEEQKLFIDIICKNYISSEKLPDNLKIIINAEESSPLITDIREVIQYIEI